MAIGMAMKEGSWVVVKDEKNNELFRKSGELHGYTGSTVTVKQGSWLIMYNEKGSETGRNSC